MMMERKVKLSAKQPEGDRNGLNQPDVLSALTEGFARGATHLAVVELSVVEQAQSEDGALTNRVALTRVEVVEGGSADSALALLRDAHAARQHDTLEGFGDENVGGRGDA